MKKIKIIMMKNLVRSMEVAVLLFSSWILALCKDDKSHDLPVLETVTISEITSTTAKSGGLISSDGGGEITAKGVCWSISTTPTLIDNKTVDGDGDGDFESILTNLNPGTKYFIRAYATNKAGTSFGNEENFTAALTDPPHGSQIIANHSIVADFNKIPQNYINLVKRMWVVVAGESHSQAYRVGLTLLESSYPAYAASIVESGTPEPYSTANLRFSRATWGNIDNSTGWIYDYGEEDWFSSATAINRTKAGITYCNTHNLALSGIGYGWCSDPNIEINDYISATQEYIDHCAANGYATRVFFTTGTVDDWEPLVYGYYKSLRNIAIRDYIAADTTRILFDYADILCHDDNGAVNTKTYEGKYFPVITDKNLGDGSIGHIGSAGAIRLAKAMWWMLARMAGWDGK